MKTNYLLILLVCICHTSLADAQSIFNEYGFYLYNNQAYGKPVKYSAPLSHLKVKNYEVIEKKENGKLIGRTTVQYNLSGYATYSAVYSSKNKLKRECMTTYLNDTQLTSRLYKNRKGDTISFYTYKFEHNRLLQSVSKQGRRITEGNYTYDNAGKTVSFESKRNGKLRYIIKYEYNTEGKLIKQSTYNSKNQLKSVTNYECNYQGETQKKVDQSKVCIRQDKLPNGGYLVYRDFTNPKGDLIRSISTFTADSNLVKREEFNVKNKRTSITLYEYNQQGYCIKYIHQYKKETYLSTYIQNENNLLLESTFSVNSKQVYKSVYTYNYY